MARVLTNNTSFSYVIETSLGVAPTSGWRLLEPNQVSAWGAEIKTVARDPISRNRQRRKGSVVDLDSKVEFSCDLIMDHAVQFLEGFMAGKFEGPGLTDGAAFLPTSVTSTHYVVGSGGALAQYTLIYADGFATSGNNGLKVVGSGSTGTTIVASGLTAETGTAARFATVSIAGVQGTTGDIQVNASGNLIATALDFTTLGLTVGQFIWVGGSTAATQFATAANTGFARITSIAAGELGLDMKTTTFATDNGATKTIQILFGRYCYNRTTDNADYIERSYTFEALFDDLEGVGTDGYEYAVGNYCNELTFTLPLADKAEMTLGFVGQDTEPPTSVRVTGPSTAATPIMTDAFSTAEDIARLHITEVDETAVTTYFKSMTLKINNNVSPEKTLGTLGATFLNMGNFHVDIEAQVLFTSGAVIDAIRNNTTMALNFALKNGDGGMLCSIPAMTLGNGKRDLPQNQTVLVQLTGMAFEDPTLGISLGVSLFPYLP